MDRTIEIIEGPLDSAISSVWASRYEPLLHKENTAPSDPAGADVDVNAYPYNLAWAIFESTEEAMKIDAQRLEEALKTLTERERDVLMYRFRDGMTLRQTGELYGVVSTYAAQIQTRAIQMLRRRSRAKLQGAVIENELDLPLGEFGFSERAYCCLRRAGVNTLRELADKTEEDILRIRGMGRQTAEEVAAKLGEHSVTLKENENPKRSFIRCCMNQFSIFSMEDRIIQACMTKFIISIKTYH